MILNIKKTAIYLASILLIAVFSLSTSLTAQADILLEGEIKLGDNNTYRINPTEMISAWDTHSGNLLYPQPNNAIHFNLTESVTLNRIDVDNISNTSARLYLVIWKEDWLKTIVVNTRSSSSNHGVFNLASNVTLPQGDYLLAIVGQCFNPGGQAKGWRNHCRNKKNWNYDDFEYTNINLHTVPSSGKTNSFAFIERRHIGDNTDSPRDGYAGRWYPDEDEGDDVEYEFTPKTDANLSSITLYNYRDLVTNSYNVELTLSEKNGNDITSTYMYSNASSGDFIWNVNRVLKANTTYELEVEVDDRGDADDISWDDIVIKFGPDIQPPDVINHYRLTYSDRALTCEPAVVTVQACTNTFQSGVACVESTSSTSATLVGNAQDGSGSISEPSGSFTGSTDIDLGYLDSGDLTLSLTGINNKSYKCNGTNNCDINFADAGFFFSYDNADGSNNIANQIAGVNFSKPIKLEAFYNKNGQCKNIFKNNEEIKVELGVQCQEPNICAPASLNLNFVADAIDLGKNSSTQEQRYSPVDLKFNNNITQINSAQYQDAGKINLIARYTINDNRNDLNGLTIKGQSNQFAVRPYQFKIKATRHEGQNGEIWTDLTAQDSNALKYTHKAGDIFTFKVQALNANQSVDTVTYNYLPNANDNLRIKLTRALPATGTFDGVFAYAPNKTLLTSTAASWVKMPDLPVFDKGVYRFVDAIYSEVGAIQINVKDKDYYGMKFSVDANFSDNSKGTEIGRFIPSQFELVSSQVDNYIGSNRHRSNGYDYVFPQHLASYVAGTTVLQPKNGKIYECREWPNDGFCIQWSEGSNQYEPGIGTDWKEAWILLISPDTGAVFTYMDQPELAFDYRLEAQNSQGVITKNYDGDDKATVNFLADIDGLDLSHRLQGYAGVWCDGVYQPESCGADAQDKGYFSRASTGPDGPMQNALFGIGITDKDGVELNNLNLPMAPNTATTRKLSIQASELRYGRWTVADGYGPISNDFATTMKLEYFDGKNFVINSDDAKTTFDSMNATLVDVSLGGALPALSGKGTFISGITQGLIIAAPNREGVVQLDYTVDDWFKYKWSDGDTGLAQSPSAKIAFGFFYGNDRVIYRRRLN